MKSSRKSKSNHRMQYDSDDDGARELPHPKAAQSFEWEDSFSWSNSISGDADDEEDDSMSFWSKLAFEDDEPPTNYEGDCWVPFSSAKSRTQSSTCNETWHCGRSNHSITLISNNNHSTNNSRQSSIFFSRSSTQHSYLKGCKYLDDDQSIEMKQIFQVVAHERNVSLEEHFSKSNKINYDDENDDRNIWNKVDGAFASRSCPPKFGDDFHSLKSSAHPSFFATEEDPTSHQQTLRTVDSAHRPDTREHPDTSISEPAKVDGGLTFHNKPGSSSSKQPFPSTGSTGFNTPSLAVRVTADLAACLTAVKAPFNESAVENKNSSATREEKKPPRRSTRNAPDLSLPPAFAIVAQVAASMSPQIVKRKKKIIRIAEEDPPTNGLSPNTTENKSTMIPSGSPTPDSCIPDSSPLLNQQEQHTAETSTEKDAPPLVGWMLRLAWQNSRPVSSTKNQSSSGQSRGYSPSAHTMLPPAFRIITAV